MASAQTVTTTMTNFIIQPGKPDISAGTGGHLSIFIQKDGSFWISDRLGYLCTTSSSVFLAELAAAERNAFPEPVTRAHYYAGARELIYPGQALERERETIARHAQMRKEYEAKQAAAAHRSTQFAHADGACVLAALGL